MIDILQRLVGEMMRWRRLRVALSDGCFFGVFAWILLPLLTGLAFGVLLAIDAVRRGDAANPEAVGTILLSAGLFGLVFGFVPTLCGLLACGVAQRLVGYVNLQIVLLCATTFASGFSYLFVRDLVFSALICACVVVATLPVWFGLRLCGLGRGEPGAGAVGGRQAAAPRSGTGFAHLPAVLSAASA